MDSSVTIGRAALTRLSASVSLNQGSLFVHTGHSARLMERLAVALQLRESLLLVGETGTGKTAIVQHIAQQIHAKLIVLNLSQQTDSSDLLGGYKPIAPKDILLPLLNPFLELLRATWTKGNNEAFAARVLKYAERGQWEKLEKAFRTAIEKIKAAELALESQHQSPVHQTKRRKHEIPTDLKSVAL